MNSSILVLVLVALVAIFGIAESQKAPTRKPIAKPTTRRPSIDCSVEKVCSEFPQPVFAYSKTKKLCYTLRNKCYFDNLNCMLLAQNEEPFQTTTHEICKKYCTSCPTEYDLVCGASNANDQRAFLSTCYMENYSCLSGKPFVALPSMEYCGATVSEQSFPTPTVN